MSVENNINLLGNLGRDVELKRWNPNDENSNQFAVFDLCHESYDGRDERGEVKKKSTWFKVEVRNKSGAEYAAKALKKGTRVMVSGELDVSKYHGKDGIERQALKIIVREMKGVLKLGKPENVTQASESTAEQYKAASGGGVATQPEQGLTAAPAASQAMSNGAAPIPAYDDPDEIPF